MKFQLATISDRYTTEDWERLARYGFRSTGTTEGWNGTLHIKDDYSPEIEFSTIEQLVAFIHEQQERIIMSEETICIYDGYAE